MWLVIDFMNIRQTAEKQIQEKASGDRRTQSRHEHDV